MVVNKRKRQLKRLRDSLYMEEKNRAKAINTRGRRTYSSPRVY